MPRKSSAIAKIKDKVHIIGDSLADLVTLVSDFDNDYESIINDAEKYRAVKSTMDKINPPEPPQEKEGPPEHKPGDLCKSCTHEKDSSQCGHDAAESCGGYEKKKRQKKGANVQDGESQ